MRKEHDKSEKETKTDLIIVFDKTNLLRDFVVPVVQITAIRCKHRISSNPKIDLIKYFKCVGFSNCVRLALVSSQPTTLVVLAQIRLFLHENF